VLTNTDRVKRAAGAARTLCEVLWESLQEQLEVRARELDGDDGAAQMQRTAELARRLADVTAAVALLAGEEASATVSLPSTRSRTADLQPSALSGTSDARTAPVLVDEHFENPSEPPTPTPLRDVTREQKVRERAPWIDLIESGLDQFEHDGLPFAVLLVELLDVEHLRLDGRAEPLPRLAHEVESAIARALEAIGIGAGSTAFVAPERSDRYWLLVSEIDRRGARALAERLVQMLGTVSAPVPAADATGRYFAALASASSRRADETNGAQLEVAVGVAVCPAHGQAADELAAHADTELASARAAGRPTASVVERW
jgi:hypothetical protein